MSHISLGFPTLYCIHLDDVVDLCRSSA